MSNDLVIVDWQPTDEFMYCDGEDFEKNMTDNEIMKALECCKDADCLNCPRMAEELCFGLVGNLVSCVLNLINRQKAEIAEYQKHIDQDIIYTKAIKAEAIKAFADRLRFEIVEKPSEFTAEKATVDFLNGLAHRQHETLDIIDNLVKEMTEDEK